MKELEGIGKITRTLASRSSMNPTLLLAAIVVPLSLLFTFLSVPPAQYFFMALAGAVVSIALLQIIGFSIFAVNRLDDHIHVENKLIIAQLQSRMGQGDRVFSIPDDSALAGNPLIEGEVK